MQYLWGARFSFAGLHGVPARVSQERVQIGLKLNKRRAAIGFRRSLHRPVFDQPAFIELSNPQGGYSSINTILFACSMNCFAATICSFRQGPSQALMGESGCPRRVAFSSRRDRDPRTEIRPWRDPGSVLGREREVWPDFRCNGCPGRQGFRGGEAKRMGPILFKSASNVADHEQEGYKENRPSVSTGVVESEFSDLY